MPNAREQKSAAQPHGSQPTTYYSKKIQLLQHERHSLFEVVHAVLVLFAYIVPT